MPTCPRRWKRPSGCLRRWHAGADVAIGSRWLDRQRQTIHQPLYRRFFGRCFNWVTRKVMGLPFKDTQCGFKAFKREAAQTIFRLQTIERWGFDPEILFHCAQAEVHDCGSAGDMGPRRAQPHELSERRHEDAGGDGARSGRTRCAAATTRRLLRFATQARW